MVLHIEDNLANLTLVERILDQRTERRAHHRHAGPPRARARPRAPTRRSCSSTCTCPTCTATQVLQRLRDDPATAPIPVVIVSADATPGQVQRLLSAGATAYLTKPIDVRELLRLLDEAAVTIH